LLINLGVQDLRNLIFLFTINVDQRWRRLGLVWNGVWSFRFQQNNMENGVDTMHAVQKLENIRA
jgi:hypothetical protein